MASIPVESLRKNMRSGISNLVWFYSQAREEEIQAGLEWYQDAQDYAQHLARTFNVPLRSVCRAIAALSPRMEWGKNKAAAKDAVAWYTTGQPIPPLSMWDRYGGDYRLSGRFEASMTNLLHDDYPLSTGPCKDNVLKALWELEGHDVLSGPKVEVFAANIEGDLSQVTVDSHAIQAWLGQTDKGTYAVPPKWMPVIAEDYKLAAELVGIEPAQFQAIVWIVKKRMS